MDLARSRLSRSNDDHTFVITLYRVVEATTGFIVYPDIDIGKTTVEIVTGVCINGGQA